MIQCALCRIISEIRTVRSILYFRSELTIATQPIHILWLIIYSSVGSTGSAPPLRTYRRLAAHWGLLPQLCLCAILTVLVVNCHGDWCAPDLPHMLGEWVDFPGSCNTLPWYYNPVTFHSHYCKSSSNLPLRSLFVLHGACLLAPATAFMARIIISFLLKTHFGCILQSLIMFLIQQLMLWWSFDCRCALSTVCGVSKTNFINPAFSLL